MNKQRVLISVSGMALVFVAVFIGRTSMLAGSPEILEEQDPDQAFLPLVHNDHVIDPAAATTSLQSTSLSIAAQINQPCFDLSVTGGLLYGACGSDLVVFDLANATAPDELGSYEGAHEATAIAIAEPYAYTIDAVGHLHVIDVSDPMSMTLVSDTAFTLGPAREAVVMDDFLYLAEGEGAEAVPTGLRVIDVHDPANPVQTSIDVLSNLEARGLVVDQSTLYLATWSVEGHGELIIYDATSPPALDFISSVVPNGAVTGVALNGAQAYVSVNGRNWGVAEMHVVDLAVLHEPYSIGSYVFPEPAGALDDPAFTARNKTPFLYGLANSGSEVFTLESHWGVDAGQSDPRMRYVLRAIDATNPAQPIGEASIELNVKYPHDLVVNGDYIYVAGGDSGVFVIHVD